MAAKPSAQPPQKLVKWRVVTTSSGKPFLHFLELEEHQPGSEVLRSVVNLCRCEVKQSALARCNCIRKFVVETAVLENADLEGTAPYRVAITDRKPHAIMTEGCRDPESFRTANFAARHPEFVVGTLSPTGTGSKAILIEHRLTRVGIGLVTLAFMVIVILPGIVVGFLSSWGSVGASVSGAIAGVLAVGKLWMRLTGAQGYGY